MSAFGSLNPAQFGGISPLSSSFAGLGRDAGGGISAGGSGVPGAETSPAIGAGDGGGGGLLGGIAHGIGSVGSAIGSGIGSLLGGGGGGGGLASEQEMERTGKPNMLV